MFSTASGTRYTAAAGKKFLAKNCQLCFCECGELNGLSYNPKLPDLCSKYLHSSLTQQSPSGSADKPFCDRCFGSAMELITFSEQMELIQKSISELVFMFSLEILHRRGKVTDNTEAIGKNLVEFDVSSLPNCEAWNKLTTVVITHVSSLQTSQQIKSEDTSIENSENEQMTVENVPDFTENNFNNVNLNSEINIENIGNNSEMWIEDGDIFNEHTAVTSNTPYVTDSELLIEYKVPTNSEVEACNSASVTTGLGTPIIHVPKLQIHGGETQVTAEEDPLKEWAKPVGAEIDVVNTSRSVQQLTGGPPNKQRQGQLTSPLNPNPTSGSSKSKLTLRGRLRSQNVSKANERDQRKGTSQKTSLYKKRIKPQSRMIAEKKSRSGKQTHRCVFCPESFNNALLLEYHHRQHRKKGAQWTCTYCPKVCGNTRDFVCHVRTHTGEKPFRCEKCDYAATRQRYLNDHIMRRHRDAASSFKCKECGRKFKMCMDFKNHFKRVHAGVEYSEGCYVIVAD